MASSIALPMPGLIGNYTMDRTFGPRELEDKSGYGNHGTFLEDAQVTNVDPLPSTAWTPLRALRVLHVLPMKRGGDDLGN